MHLRVAPGVSLVLLEPVCKVRIVCILICLGDLYYPECSKLKLRILYEDIKEQPIFWHIICTYLNISKAPDYEICIWFRGVRTK